ncbi:MAG: hypothetical protein IJQ81_01160 [Oscillibacter sp.]|nr:hypothetical protein [Oscillibacter sp.]
MNTRAIASLCLTATLLLSGCSGGGTATHRQNSVSGVQSVLDSAIAASDAATVDATPTNDATADDVTLTDNATIADVTLSDNATEYADDDVIAESAFNAEEGIDVDLTRLNSTMIFSEVNRMMYEPEEFLGKTIRMAGQFALAFGYDEDGEVNPEQVYFACIIPDATACCSSGIEFERDGVYRYPEDYPEEGDDITVTGVFEMYEEYGLEYYHLADAVMEA